MVTITRQPHTTPDTPTAIAVLPLLTVMVGEGKEVHKIIIPLYTH